VPPAQLRNNILLYLLYVTPRVDRIGRYAQPVGGHVARSGTVVAARNEYNLVFTSMEVISYNEMMPITFQRATRFRNKESRIRLKLIKKVGSINDDTRIYSIYETLNETMNPSGVHSSISGSNILGT
jgi:hypothetical protein